MSLLSLAADDTSVCLWPSHVPSFSTRCALCPWLYTNEAPLVSRVVRYARKSTLSAYIIHDQISYGNCPSSYLLDQPSRVCLWITRGYLGNAHRVVALTLQKNLKLPIQYTLLSFLSPLLLNTSWFTIVIASFFSTVIMRINAIMSLLSSRERISSKSQYLTLVQ